MYRGQEEEEEEEGTCTDCGYSRGGDGGCEQSDVTNCKLQLGTNGVTDKVVAHLEEVVRGNGDGSLKEFQHSFKNL